MNPVQTYIARDEFMGMAPEASVTDGAQMSKLERALRDFNDYYNRLTDVRFGAAIGRLAGTPDGNALNQEYGAELQRAETAKRRIESVLGVWDSVKRMVGLGALPLIPIAVAIALTATISAVAATGRNFMRRADIRLAMQADPDLSYEQAVRAVDSASRGALEKSIDVVQYGISAFVVYMVLKYLRE